MSQTPADKSGQSATARAEDTFERMGERVGLLAARARQRLQETTAALREQAERVDQSQRARAEKSNAQTLAGGSTQPAAARAEELVDRVGERLGHVTARVGFEMQRFGARMREDAEDMWFEAQQIRQRTRSQ